MNEGLGVVRGEGRVGSVLGIVLATALFVFAAASACPTPASADEGRYLIELKDEEPRVSHTSDDLFAHIPDMEPGETYSGAVEIKNSSESGVAAFIYADEWVGDGGDPASELLDGVRLSLAYGGAEVYEGAIGAAGMREVRELGVLRPGSSDCLAYEISLAPDVPEALYGLRNAVRWHIGFKEVAAVEDSGRGGAPGAPLSRAGDGASRLFAVLVLAAASSGACAVLVGRGREEGDSHE